MRLPRNISGVELAGLLSRFGHVVTRQTGSHLRLTTTQKGEHHLTISNHNPLKAGTLNEIIGDVAEHFGISKDMAMRELMPRL